MANIKSQKKRNITNEKARMRNRAVKSELKTATRRVKDAVAAGNGAEAFAAAMAACRLMDKAVSKGVIHKNQAANRKSGIMALVNPIVTDEDRAAYVKPAPKQANTGSKKAARKAEREAEMKKANEEKAKRREKQLKEEKKAAERKAKEAEEAAKAEAEAAAAEAAAAEAEAAEEATEEAAE
ncbi:MAG: 30S ribosomal protein S20 [Coriobacteriaceae bacterium]|nr:30S ribosomal protein S20 [Coriobacteriaceae bacterium]